MAIEDVQIGHPDRVKEGISLGLRHAEVYRGAMLLLRIRYMRVDIMPRAHH